MVSGTGWAITSFILSIVALLLGWIPIVGAIIWIAALILSIITIKKIKAGSEGRGMAVAGLVISVIAAVIYVFFLLFYLLAAIGAAAFFG